MASSLTLWDARALARAGLSAALVLLLAVLVTAATDEGGLSWAERVSRSLPLTPGCAAVGAWVALAPARARGDTLALQALGRSRLQIAGGAVAGASAVALAAAVAIGSLAVVDVGAFYPRAARTPAWAWQGDGFDNPTQGLRVDVQGVPTLRPRDTQAAERGLPRHGQAAAALSTLAAGLALALLVAHATAGVGTRQPPPSARRRLVARFAPAAWTAGTVAAALVAFQAAAAGRVPALVAVAPPLALLAFALRRYRALP